MDKIFGIIAILLIIAGGLVLVDSVKYVKKHENELVENISKGLMGRIIGMTIITLCLCVIGVLFIIIG